MESVDPYGHAISLIKWILNVSIDFTIGSMSPDEVENLKATKTLVDGLSE